MQTKCSYSRSRAEWSQETHPIPEGWLKPAPANPPREKKAPRREKPFFFFLDGAWRSEAALTRSEARAQLMKRLGLTKLPAGASLKSKAQRKVRREDHRAQKQSVAQVATTD